MTAKSQKKQMTKMTTQIQNDKPDKKMTTK